MSKGEKRSWSVEVFYDGDCPLCCREINMLRRLDQRKRIQFTDIATETFDAATYGKSMPELMDEIHGRLPNGQWIIGVEVFRQLYTAVGFSPVVWLTRLPPISQLLDFGYRIFAKHRLRLTGRCTPESCEIS
ncbi:MAG: thiol-disulfide oxidoreductase DCC family protein [Rubripirellula sp.]